MTTTSRLPACAATLAFIIGDAYWVDASIIEASRPNEPKQVQ